MKQLYGTAFLTAYGNSPPPLWENAIARLSDAQCARGLAQLAREKREYPANLSQFVAACEHREPVRYLGVPTTPEKLALENPRREVPRELIDRHLAEMRRVIGPAVEDPPPHELPACTCRSLGECAVCVDWARRMLELRRPAPAETA